MTAGKEYVTIAGCKVCLADLPADMAATIRAEMDKGRRPDEPAQLPDQIGLKDDAAAPTCHTTNEGRPSTERESIQGNTEPAGLRPLEETAAERRATLARYDLHSADAPAVRPDDDDDDETFPPEVLARAREIILDYRARGLDGPTVLTACRQAARELENAEAVPDTVPARRTLAEADYLEIGQPEIGKRGPPRAIRVHLRRDPAKPGELRYRDPAGRWHHACRECGQTAVLRQRVGHAWGCAQWNEF